MQGARLADPQPKAFPAEIYPNRDLAGFKATVVFLTTVQCTN